MQSTAQGQEGGMVGVLERYKDEVFPPTLLAQVEDLLTATEHTLADAQTDLALTREERQALAGLLESREGILTASMALLREARGVSAGWRSAVFSETTRACLTEVEGVLDGAEDGVVVDMGRMEGEIERLVRREEALVGNIAMLRERVEVLEKGKEGLVRGMTDEARAGLLALRRDGVLHFGECINCEVREYRAFGGVDDVFDIKKVMKQPLIDVGEGIRMSNPINVDLKLRTGVIASVSISHTGVIAIYDISNNLQLTNLLTRHRVEFRVESWTATAFYDDKVVVMTWGQGLREASDIELLQRPCIDTLRVMGDVPLGYCPPNTLTQQTRKVYTENRAHMLYEYDVDTKLNSKVDIKYWVFYVASSCGINMGVKCLFTGEHNRVYALNVDNSVGCVNPEEEPFGDRITSVLASSSNASDFKKVLCLVNGTIVYKGKEVYLKTPVTFDRFYTTVRIYKDIFLVYDKDEKQWKLLRIIIR